MQHSKAFGKHSKREQWEQESGKGRGVQGSRVYVRWGCSGIKGRTVMVKHTTFLTRKPCDTAVGRVAKELLQMGAPASYWKIKVQIPISVVYCSFLFEIRQPLSYFSDILLVAIVIFTPWLSDRASLWLKQQQPLWLFILPPRQLCPALLVAYISCLKKKMPAIMAEFSSYSPFFLFPLSHVKALEKRLWY